MGSGNSTIKFKNNTSMDLYYKINEPKKKYRSQCYLILPGSTDNFKNIKNIFHKIEWDIDRNLCNAAVWTKFEEKQHLDMSTNKKLKFYMEVQSNNTFVIYSKEVSPS